MIIATDLDGTIIHTGGVMDHDVCVEYYNDAPLSFVTQAAIPLLQRLAEAALVVPATTRLPSQYDRVVLPWGPRPWVVCSNGAVVLRDGQPDLQWASHIAEQIARLDVSYQDVTAMASQLLSSGASGCTTLREVPGDLFCYLVGDPSSAQPGLWEATAATMRGHGWMRSVQRRKVYFVPHCVEKSAAVAYVCGQTGMELVAAAGDSALDAKFLANARCAVPERGELHGHTPECEIITGSGVRSGEATIWWLFDRALEPVSV
jgi:hydroxymethylpyrimidine pyrophosphatase-like HAD family hydrolase